MCIIIRRGLSGCQAGKPEARFPKMVWGEWLSFFKEGADHSDAAVQSHAGAVGHYVEAFRTAPFFIGEEVVIERPLLIHLPDQCFRFLLLHVLAFHDTGHPILPFRMNEDGNDAGIIRQDGIGAAADDDAGFLVCELADDL